jgi:hypothetical protein
LIVGKRVPHYAGTITSLCVFAAPAARYPSGSAWIVNLISLRIDREQFREIALPLPECRYRFQDGARILYFCFFQSVKTEKEEEAIFAIIKPGND